MQNARLNEAQAGINIARININNFRYTDDTTLMPESKEELKSLLMKVKEETEKAGLKLNIQKTNITASGAISSVQFGCSVMSDSLRTHEPQHTRPPCPSPTPGVYLNSCPLSPLSDAIQPSHPLSSPSPPAFSLWLVITILPRSKCLLISWLQSPSAVILEPPKLSLPLFPLFPHLFAMK